MIWWYLVFCVFVFVITLWVQIREEGNLSWGRLVQLFIGSVTPIANIAVLIICLVLLGYDKWNKEVFK